MTPATKEALLQSIAKWEKNSRVRNLYNAKTGSGDCPLCLLFFYSLAAAIIGFNRRVAS